jgi:hypothetical protein
MSIPAKQTYYMEVMRDRRAAEAQYYSLTIEITHAGHTIRLEQWEEESETWKPFVCDPPRGNPFFVVRGESAPMSEWHDIPSSQGKWVIRPGRKYTITSTVNNGKDPYTTPPRIIDDVKFSDLIGRSGYQIYFDTDKNVFYFNQPGWSRRR